MAKMFSVDPNSYDKQIEFGRAVEYVREFLDENGLEHPRRINSSLPRGGMSKRYGCYYFKSKQLYVNLKKTRTPVKNPGFSWSYTGFKADLTAPGVLAHETGHHVHNLIENGKNFNAIFNSCAAIARQENNVSSYEPNHSEFLAEAFKLFILNPVLLAEGRPLRYKLLTQSFGLKPLHQEDWRKVLQHAHPKLIEASEKWIIASKK